MALDRVKFEKPRGQVPRLSESYVPGSHSDRFWADWEIDIIKREYQKNGPAACKVKLPHRPLGSIYRKANALGLSARQHPGARQTHRSSPELDAEIRRRWPTLTGRPVWSRRALTWGLRPPIRWLYMPSPAAHLPDSAGSKDQPGRLPAPGFSLAVRFVPRSRIGVGATIAPNVVPSAPEYRIDAQPCTRPRCAVCPVITIESKGRGAVFSVRSYPEQRLLALVDEFDATNPSRSVTNDAEQVIDALARSGLLEVPVRVVYRDTMGVWDELLISDKRFAGFKPLRKSTLHDAAAAVSSSS